jgi:tetratricopeptide (TPR) repeat protein
MTQPVYSVGERVLAQFLAHGTEPAELGILRRHAAVEQARSEIRYGNLEQGAELLEGVAQEIVDLPDQGNRGLLALTFSVWGQGLQTWGDAEAAKVYFRKAVDEFTDKWGPDFDDDTVAIHIGSRALADLGIALAGIGDHERAQRVLWTGRRLGPSTPEATRRLAGYVAAEGSLEQARELLDEALPVLPTDAECWYAMGQIRERAHEHGAVSSYQQAAALWLRRGAFGQSLPAIKRLQELRPSDPTVLTALAEALRNTGRAAEAETIVDRAVAVAPEQFEPLLARALVHRELNKGDEAFRDIERALALHADEPSALVVLAYLHADRGDLDRSLEAAKKALEVDPEHHPAQAHLGQILMQQERYAEAREPLLAAHMASPGDINLATLYARLAAHLGDAEAVVETLVPIWRGDALEPADVANLVNALIARNELENAVVVARAKHEASPNDSVLKRLLAAALARRAFEHAGDMDAVSAAAEEATALSPDDPDVEVLRGIVEKAEGRADVAERLFAAALKKAPSHSEALAQLVELLAEQDRTAEGEKWARVGFDVTGLLYFRLQTASMLLQQNRNQEALTFLSDLPSDVGEYHGTWLSLRAEAEEALGMWESAATDRAAVAELQPESPEAWFALAESARLAGDWEKAIDASRRVLQMQPDHMLAYGTLGSALAIGGKTDEGRKELDEALRRDPQYVFALQERARLSSTLEEALGFLSRLAEISDDLEVRIQRGWVLQDHDQISDALTEFESALASAPDDIRVLIGASACLSRLGKHDEATARAQHAVELDPDNVSALQTLADARNNSGAPSEALVYLRQALEIAPKEVDTVQRLAKTLKDLDQVEESLRLLDEIVQHRSADPVTWSILGSHLTDLGYFDEGIGPLRRSLTLGATDAWIHNDLGWALMFADMPDLNSALAEFSEANRLAPDRLWLMKNLANAQHELRIDGAEALYKRVIEQGERSRRDLDIESLIGWCLFRLRELKRAGRHLFAATARPVDNEPVRLDLGLISLCQGRDEQALHHYESAIASLAGRALRRRRGPLRVAQIDLEIACRDWEGLNDRKATLRIRGMLTQALSEVPGLPQLKALGKAPPARPHVASEAIASGSDAKKS